jgi:hypothetical protein
MKKTRSKKSRDTVPLNSILNAKESYSVGTAGVVVTVENPDSGIYIIMKFLIGVHVQF